MLSPAAVFDAMREVVTVKSEPHEPEAKQPSHGSSNGPDDAADQYYEPEPSVGEWLRSLVPTKKGPLRYVRSVFLFAEWLPRYNLAWLVGDSVAGLTVGFVVIPQAMAYALLADLSPEYGLYTSFVGAALYWIFGTSKDIVIGTTAVGSLLVGSVIASVQEQRPGVYSNEEIAKALSAVSGIILLFVGLVRLGWVIEFIPYIPISAFVTGASVTIMATQFPVAMGISGVNTREAPYLVIVNSLKGLPRTRVDAAIGLSSIVLLYAIRHLCGTLEARDPSRRKVWAAMSSLRLTFTMLLYTLISWLVNRNRAGPSPFRIVGKIEKGFQHAGAPPLNSDLVALVLPKLPAVIIILVIEHIAIAKSFGRAFNYTVIPSQEILAQGASNLLGTFVGGYVCTGSFGASAVLSKAGVRTPLAGLFSAVILVLALHVLTTVFYYIPNAALAGLIIHAVANLPTPPRVVYKYWRLSPPEFVIWVIGVALAVFVSLEVSIYATICVSLALVLIRIARARGHFLGHARVSRLKPSELNPSQHFSSVGPPTTQPRPSMPRDVYLPLHHADGSNPRLALAAAHPGVFIYRFPAGLSYLNQGQHMHRLIKHIQAHTRRGRTSSSSSSSSAQRRATNNPTKPNDNNDAATTRLWCEAPPPRQNMLQQQQHDADDNDEQLPPLRAVVLDFTAVDTLDITAAQGLADARAALDRHAHGGAGEEEGSRLAVQWHFAGVGNRWARRALAGVGFGGGGGGGGSGGKGEGGDWAWAGGRDGNEGGKGDEEGRWVPVRRLDRPCFHVDLAGAVEAAVWEARRQEE